MTENIWNNENLIKVLKENGVVVMPTDTIYGIVASALSEDAVNRIYKIRKRNPDKPCIILVGALDELKISDIVLTDAQKKEIKKYKEPTSFVLDCANEKFKYLHRGTNTLAFRLPAQANLQELLLKVGPLIAPSANLETLPPSENINDAKNYFGDKVDLYIDGGSIMSRASKVIKLHKDWSVTILRE